MKRLKLNQLSSFSLSEMEMGQVKGGQMTKGNCACACKYAQKGGSSTSGNANANNKSGLRSPGMDTEPEKEHYRVYPHHLIIVTGKQIGRAHV